MVLNDPPWAAMFDVMYPMDILRSLTVCPHAKVRGISSHDQMVTGPMYIKLLTEEFPACCTFEFVVPCARTPVGKGIGV